jgi:hypothetical protein
MSPAAAKAALVGAVLLQSHEHLLGPPFALALLLLLLVDVRLGQHDLQLLLLLPPAQALLQKPL